MALGQPAYRRPKGDGTRACWQSEEVGNRLKTGPARPAPQGESDTASIPISSGEMELPQERRL